NAVGEIILFPVTAQIGEGQDSDRRAVRQPELVLLLLQGKCSRRSRWPLAPDAPDRAGKIVGLGLRPCPKLVRQCPPASVILRQRSVVPALRRIESHQTAMYPLLQRIEGEQLEAMGERLLEPLVPLRLLHEASLDAAGEVPESLALRREPLLE